MIHAHLLCAAVASGGGLDCAVVVDADRAAVWERVFDGHVTIASELPFGAPQTASRAIVTPPAPGGDRYGAAAPFAAGDFLPCAKTTVTAELVGDGGVVWRGSIALPRRGCAPPRVKPRVSCAWLIVMFQGPSYDGYHPEPSFDHNAVACDMKLDRAPAVPFHVYAQLADDRGDAELATVSGGVELGQPADATCTGARVQVAITTAAGALVWRGTKTVDCAAGLREEIVNQ